ncbi:unnamed protein product, partial [Discosporangium mesarthrocarpum]
SFLLSGARAFYAAPASQTRSLTGVVSRRKATVAAALGPSIGHRGGSHPHTRVSMSSSAQEPAAKEEKKATGHQPPSGHQSGGGKARSPEEEALLARIQAHQEGAARLTKTEEVRNLIQYSIGFGVLSTNSRTMPGYPGGSVVGFGLDDAGRPLFAFSSMSSHTGDLAADSRVSLTVTAASFKGAADGRVSFMGDVNKVPEEDLASVREAYKKKHPNAYWVDFGDFRLMRMDTIKAIRFVGGFAMAGDIEPQDYLSTSPDPVAEFSAPILKHMNDDHAETTKAMVEHYIMGGGEARHCNQVKSAEITAVDRLGIYVLVGMLDGQSGKLRLPFPRPAESRKDVKDLIVEMTREAAAASS